MSHHHPIARPAVWSGSVLTRWLAPRLLLGLVLLLSVPSGRADAPPLTEYQVKAMFLFNFAKYVDWPETAFATSNSPIIIGVLGQDKFQDDLKRTIEGKTINGRNIELRRPSNDAEIGACHILFVSASERPRFEKILGKAAALPILTVGEDEQFLPKGGIINFVLKEGKVRLEIDLPAARTAKLGISSRLLRVADTVRGK